MNYRIKQIFISITPVLLVFLAIYIVQDWNQGELVIKNAKETKVMIGSETIEIDSNEFTKNLWPDKYSITLEKKGYYYYKKDIEIKRGEKVSFTPNFVFIPKIIPINAKIPFQIPSLKMLKNEEGNIIYSDNQEDIAHLNLEPKELSNLPDNLLYILFNSTGQKAIIITSTATLEQNNHYYYDLKNAELTPIKPNKRLSGFSWNSTGDQFVFFEPMKENEGRIVLYNTALKKESEITRLYNFQSLYTNFAQKNQKLIILGVNNQRDLLMIDLKSGRKEKLTNSGFIDNLKISHDQSGVFYKEIKNNIQQISFLDLNNRKLYRLPEADYEYLRKIDYLPKLKKIIYTDAKESILDLPKINELDSISQDKYYLYDLAQFQTEILPISEKVPTHLKRYTTISPQGNIITFVGEDNYFYQLIIDN